MRFFRGQLSIQNSAVASLLGALALAGCEEGLSGMGQASLSATGDTVEVVEIDVSAPEAFSIIDMALWDGRPTFGGVWIAYPDIEKPERVRITNDATGKVVIGALYKRERDFPGPKIELSADAAAALGVQAGTPIELIIVALRRKSVEVVVEAEEPNMTTPLRRPVPEPVEDPAPAELPVVVAPDAIVPPIAVPTPTPIIATDIEETVLAPVNSAIEASDGQGSYVQVATLQSKSRADAVVAKLITAGLDVEIRERQAGTKTLYRIVVGPAKTAEALEVMMSVIKELGYKDAIVLG